jgi:hypothetical protein
MPGPPPKLPYERRRRNADHFDELPADGYQGDFPPLPTTYKIRVVDGKTHHTKTRRFLPSTRAWYEAWARSPMAVEFANVHWLRLQSIAKLQDRFDCGDVSVAAELRLGVASFGGTPHDLRRLGRTVARPQQPERGRGASADARSRRSRLERGDARLELVTDGAGA